MYLERLEEKDNIVYDCRWSNSLDEKFIEDFCRVENAVFGEYSKKKFDRKFINNIYGESVIEVVYLNDAPVAARALWRNDIEGRECYQPCDTCVLEVCRGKGIFTEMTKKAMAFLPKSACIYNFPNQNSFPGYIKMGWKIKESYTMRLFTVKRYQTEHPLMMDNEYAFWWLNPNGKYKYIKRKGHYYLVRFAGRICCYRIVAEVDENVAKTYKRNMFGIIFYKSIKETFYNRKFLKSYVVYKAEDDIDYIPIWKIDAI